ncbi:hypothetical protein Pmani_016834 [Petrolisthes manimaculis]|uniref:Uncharacterized protein n=1 Tax=Petrolisthes manimaculis TaxID=1843537 RepID=A0AAE1U6C4_9EUCA|nr:hypothetical protein Pmani_016834 [Petrolisthes manimaculis]
MEFSLEHIEPSLQMGSADISALCDTYLHDPTSTHTTFHTPFHNNNNNNFSNRFHKISSPEEWGEEEVSEWSSEVVSEAKT